MWDEIPDYTIPAREKFESLFTRINAWLNDDVHKNDDDTYYVNKTLADYRKEKVHIAIEDADFDLARMRPILIASVVIGPFDKINKDVTLEELLKRAANCRVGRLVINWEGNLEVRVSGFFDGLNAMNMSALINEAAECAHEVRKKAFPFKEIKKKERKPPKYFL